MRIRTWLAWWAGVVVGAAAMYLLDPEHGPRRRREARRDALQRLRRAATGALATARAQASAAAAAGVEGYRSSRITDS